MTNSVRGDDASGGAWGPGLKRGAVSFTFDNLGEAADLEFGTWPKDVAVGTHYTVVDVLPALLRKLGADLHAGTQLMFGLTGYVEEKDKKDESPRKDQR